MLGLFLIQNIPGDELKLQTTHVKLAPGSTFIGTFKSCIGSYSELQVKPELPLLLHPPISYMHCCTIGYLGFRVPFCSPICTSLVYFDLLCPYYSEYPHIYTHPTATTTDQECSYCKFLYGTKQKPAEICHQPADVCLLYHTGKTT